MSHHVKVVQSERIEQLEGNLCAFEFEAGDASLRVAIDCEDRSLLHPNADAFDLYFKLQYRRGGYGDGRVVPGGYVSPKLSLYRHAPRLRQLSKCNDVFGRFGTTYNGEQRARVVTAFRAQTELVFAGGTDRRSWLEYVDDLARARISLDLPGRGEFCYRLVESLAVGCVVVGPQLANELHVDLDQVRLSVPEDDLVTRCAELVAEPERLISFAAESAAFFDRYLALRQVGAYYLHTCHSYVLRIGNESHRVTAGV